MRIAVTASTNTGLAAPVAQHFGHAPYFVLLDVVEGEVSGVEVVANPYLDGHRPGQIPQFLSERKVEAILSGGMGGRAIGFFEQCGVTPVSGVGGTVAAAVVGYLDGRLLGAEPCTQSVAHGHS